MVNLKRKTSVKKVAQMVFDDLKKDNLHFGGLSWNMFEWLKKNQKMIILDKDVEAAYRNKYDQPINDFTIIVAYIGDRIGELTMQQQN